MDYIEEGEIKLLKIDSFCNDLNILLKKNSMDTIQIQIRIKVFKSGIN